MPLVNDIKSYSRCSYRLKEIMPLVNGVKFYCIYSQRLSQITVVVSGVKSYSMCAVVASSVKSFLCFIITQKTLSFACIPYCFFHFAKEFNSCTGIQYLRQLQL